MCGITGVLNRVDAPPVTEATLRQMLAMIRHRGPDEIGIYRDEWVGLGNARLSIIDLSGGQQPISNEDGTLWIVFNGEIFNYLELRPELEARGHQFATHCDTEVIVHLYEDYGPGCLSRLNGQFAIAIWDTRNRSLFLARDRLGIRPIFYTRNDQQLVFGSEIKALLACPGVNAEINHDALDQVFVYWSALSPNTVFNGIWEVPPGHYLLAKDNALSVEPYWSLDFEVDRTAQPEQVYLEELEALLIDATRIRLRADVPVGAYLSGGLDSSLTTALIRNYTHNRLDTFSIAFADNPGFDESAFQRRMAAHLGTDHRVVQCTHADIGAVFPEVVWHTETPVLRTAPAPMFLLSKLVHEHNLKVVLTGEGADEFLAGYDIFKEMKIRRFWAQHPESQIRPLLLKRIYPDIANLGSLNNTFLNAFFKRGLADTGSPYYSHAIRWSNTARTQRFLAHQRLEEDARLPLTVPPGFHRWSSLGQAQYLESTVFLPQYLLSSQGDRMAMANSVEGRYPFLDYRVVEFCNRLPPDVKMPGLREKWLLKQIGRRLLPPEIWQRTKRPYRAPIHRSFYGQHTPDYVEELLSDSALRESGLFNPAAVAQLTHKATNGGGLSETDEMALVGVLSTQLVYQQFVKTFNLAPYDTCSPAKVVDRVTTEIGASVAVGK
ncbi:MAG: asparagine synthase (glutamine-hydrolyzing) [Chloroflexi bacterium]|nr:asparagine synthase (glutamine-hydrolyzing) [Chloroflexota bacterium]